MTDSPLEQALAAAVAGHPATAATDDVVDVSHGAAGIDVDMTAHESGQDDV